MEITEKEIKETEEKTYAYFSSVIAGTLVPHILVYLYLFFSDLDDYLTYHNIPDDNREVSHYVDVTGMILIGCLSAILILVLFFVIRFWVRRVKRVERKALVIVISSILFLFSIPVLGYISFFIIGLFSI